MTQTFGVSQIKKDILHSVRRNMAVHGIRNPMVGLGAPDYKYLYTNEYFWTDPFWTGQLWLAYSLTGEESLKNSARARNSLLEDVLNNPLWIDHDLGFTFSLTAVADYKLTGSKTARSLALRAAEALRNRFNHCGNYIQAWNAGPHDAEHASKVQGKIIIDCMQNLGLLMWAYKETGVTSFKEVALAQAKTSEDFLVRDDFSTYHTFDFDPKTGQPVGGNTHQGYSDESCWSRGQSWAVHGFAQLAETTGNRHYAEISAKLADYIEDVITPDYVPVWDYRLPAEEPQHKDTSAGSITSAGLFILSNFFERIGEQQRADKYRDMANKMLVGLRELHDLTNHEHAQGLLSGAASFVKEGYLENKSYKYDGMLPYGDYYYFEAVMRANGHNDFFWN